MNMRIGESPVRLILAAALCICSTASTAEDAEAETSNAAFETVCTVAGSESLSQQPINVSELYQKGCSTLILQAGHHLFSSRHAIPMKLCEIKGESAEVYLTTVLQFKCANVTLHGSLKFKAGGTGIHVRAGYHKHGDVNFAPLSNVTFEGMSSKFSGGCLTAGNIVLAGRVSFENCLSASFGGAMYALGSTSILEGASASITNCSARFGGGIHSTGISISGSFACENCRALVKGGAMWSSSYVNIAGITSFKHCSAGCRAGAIMAITSFVITGHSYFKHCSTLGKCYLYGVSYKLEAGGAVFANKDMLIGAGGEASFENCSSYQGGAADVQGLANVSGKVTFKSCRATRSGGGLQSKNLKLSEESDSYFWNCTSRFGGGLLSPGTIQLSGRALFEDCRAWNTGGGLYGFSTTNVSGNVLFHRCHASWGGGLYTAKDSTLNILGGANMTFSSCQAGQYGGGLATDSDLRMFANSRSTFNNCLAHKYGGGLHVMASDSSADISVSSTTNMVYVGHSAEASFRNCSAGEGGGIYRGMVTDRKVHDPEFIVKGKLLFDTCSANIGSAIRIPFSDGALTFGNRSYVTFDNFCSDRLTRSLIAAQLNSQPLHLRLRAAYGWLPSENKEGGMSCTQCPFGSFSLNDNPGLGTVCVDCDNLSNQSGHVFSCFGGVVQVPAGAMLTRHASDPNALNPWKYSAWKCPNYNACQAVEVTGPFSSTPCVEGYFSDSDLPACAVCSYGHTPSRQDPFACEKCTGSFEVSVLTSTAFYLVSVYSAGRPRSPLSAIQNMILSWATSSNVLLNVMSANDLTGFPMAGLIQRLIGYSMPGIRGRACFTETQCTNLRCAWFDLGLGLGMPLMIYPLAEIFYRLGAKRGFMFGPHGDLRTRLSVHAVIALNYFMPTFVGDLVKLVPCAVVQTSEGGDTVRVSWYWSETCYSTKHGIARVMAILGILICFVVGPGFLCLLIKRGPPGVRWNEETRERVMGFALDVYHQDSTLWDAWIMIRKMMLVGVSVLFPLSTNPSLFSIVTLGVLATSTIAHAYVQPYRLTWFGRATHITLNRLEDVAQIVPLASCFLALCVLDVIAKRSFVFEAIAVYILIAAMNLFAGVLLAWAYLKAAWNEDTTQFAVKRIHDTLVHVKSAAHQMGRSFSERDHGLSHAASHTIEHLTDGVYHVKAGVVHLQESLHDRLHRSSSSSGRERSNVRQKSWRQGRHGMWHADTTPLLGS